MKEQINLLRQLQELVLTRDERHQAGDSAHLDALNDSIDQMRSKLLPQVGGLYDRLYMKNHVVIAALNNGTCCACGMHVPIAQAQQVRLGQHLVTCSSCGRILFANDTGASLNSTDRGDRDNPKTGIARFSDEKLMLADFNGGNRDAAIVALAKLMEDNGYIKNAEQLVNAALEREAILSTATPGEGVALPHVRGVEGGALTMAMAVSPEGIEWGDEKVHVVILSAIPVAVSAFYLRLMAGLSQGLSKKDNWSALMAAKDAETLWKILCKATRNTVR